MGWLRASAQLGLWLERLADQPVMSERVDDFNAEDVQLVLLIQSLRDLPGSLVSARR